MISPRILLVGALFALVCLTLVPEAESHKLHLVGKLVLKKAFKVLKKNPVIPLVIPLPIIKHHPKKKEIWKVEEAHGWEPHGWESNGWESQGGWH